jgi:hypothetical protein
MISVPILTIWVISLPLATFILLYKNIKKDKENKISQYFLILYQGLKKDQFYWEFINTARKLLILVLFPLSTSLKMLCAIVILASFTRLQMYLKPYKNSSNDNVEILATNAGVLTIFSGLLYSQPEEVRSLNVFTLV